jgi:hypothetical protein
MRRRGSPGSFNPRALTPVSAVLRPDGSYDISDADGTIVARVREEDGKEHLGIPLG